MGKQGVQTSSSDIVKGTTPLTDAGIGSQTGSYSSPSICSIPSVAICPSPSPQPAPSVVPEIETPQLSQEQSIDSIPQPSNTIPRPPKRKEPANKSKYWAYFTRLKLPNSEDLDPNFCECNLCKATVKCDVRKNGTSSMKYHVNYKCPNHPLAPKPVLGDTRQSRLSLDSVTGVRSHKFNKAKCDEKCIAMIIKNELPFRFVEKEGFRAFVNELCPEWPILTRKQIARGVMDMFIHERALLMSGLKASNTRVSITTDTWTSIQNINYMVLTAHFLDSDWKLCKRIINFCPITSHRGEEIGKAVDACLRQWELTKIFTITVDNASSNDVAVQFIKRRLRAYKTLLFDGDFLHLRCACHIINLIVKDGLKELEVGVLAIWNCVKFIRSSSARLDKFREFAVQDGCRANANIPLDVCTRWNITYLMLEAALKYEPTFGRMAFDDDAFSSYFLDKEGPPTHLDWRNAEAFCLFLKKFYDAIVALSAWKSVTANILFKEMNTLQSEINRACESADLCLNRVGRCMRDKFNKYWGSTDTMNKVIILANVLDPRYKMDWCHMAFQKMNYTDEAIVSIETELKNILMRMYEEYKVEARTEVAATESQMSLGSADELDGMDEVSREIAMKRMASQQVCIRNKVDQYLNDMYVDISMANFDVAKWWRGNEVAYPILSRLAKDIFAIPCSTVASENAFSLGSRVVDPFRSCLTPQMVEALVCSSDWLRSDPVNLHKTPTDDECVFYKELEDLQKELAGASATWGSASGPEAMAADSTATPMQHD